MAAYPRLATGVGEQVHFAKVISRCQELALVGAAHGVDVGAIRPLRPDPYRGRRNGQQEAEAFRPLSLLLTPSAHPGKRNCSGGAFNSTQQVGQKRGAFRLCLWVKRGSQHGRRWLHLKPNPHLAGFLKFKVLRRCWRAEHPLLPRTRRPLLPPAGPGADTFLALTKHPEAQNAGGRSPFQVAHSLSAGDLPAGGGIPWDGKEEGKSRAACSLSIAG